MAILGVDIGGTQVKAGLVTRDGQVVRQLRIPTPASLSGFAEQVPALIRSLNADRLEGIGVGCKGVIHPRSTRVDVLPGTVNYLEGSHLRDFLPAGVPVVGDNVARAALAGEVMWGSAKGRQNVLMLTLGTGVGGGALVDGRLVRGTGGVAGHVGHYTIDPDGPLCMCGNRGCLETFFSSRAIESAAAELLHRGVATRLPSAPDCEQVFAAARADDGPARWIISRATARLSGALAGLFLLLDPEILILGGQIAGALDVFGEQLRTALHERTGPMLRREVPIVVARQADGVLGAAALIALAP